ncbi:DNA polymerase Y family protein [Ramlibacter rhizophilus]|uniref:DNA polymerase Y family protein n=1 Tax=Ramlibacter rhizophilus TaxID=1781167 RepID=A0A4Z0BVH5_9BURK|nr:DNA polymerase Y family protein [Ramlibacter rhizophilus]TFZ03317.1 DNA polymerase Y family protein [Ramlibacter rhizophilus]
MPHWIALPRPPAEDDAQAWSWHALRFTPRVAWLDEALLLEVSASERLFGGRESLRRQLLAPGEPLAAPAHWAEGATCLVALALLRLKARGQALPALLPQGLPLGAMSAALPHVPLLERTGVRTWGQLRALPRGPVARRFGAGLLEALDIAWGERPARHHWLQLPEVFDLNVELPSLATAAPELMWTAQRLLGQMQLWLRARHRGVLALALEWTLDLKRLDGVALPSHERLVVRTAEPAQETAHLRRLVGEQLGRAQLAAPANHLRLRSLETAPWKAASRSFLPEDNVSGDKLHELIERLSARLGEDSVLVPQPRDDWRPERMQAWTPAVKAPPSLRPSATPRAAAPTQPSPRGGGEDRSGAGALYPPWLLPEPLPLPVRDHRPWYQGPLRLLTRRQRIETGWWEEGGAVVRDYCIARSEQAGLLWVFCEQSAATGGEPRWFLQGLYA